ncbi:uncharacterized protein [Haliotis cracherodii]|uniref:uncharacterized protein n=1 Tax=Haliotis cracherodii TaxID=6455 RepID=UPI0039ECF7E0
MGFANASGWAKLALFVLILGAVLDIAGYATTSWVVYQSSDGATKVNLGLWTITACQSSVCQTAAVTDAYVNTLFNVMRIMETIGLIIAVFLCFFVAVYVFIDSMKTSTIVRTAMVLCFLAGIIIFIGMCLCLAYVPFPYVVSFSMGLTVLGYLLILIAGALLIPDSCEPRDYD